MARITSQSPLPPVYRLAIFAAEAVVLATWVALPLAIETTLGLFVCYFVVVSALAFGVAAVKREPRLPRMGDTFVCSFCRVMKFKSWFLLWVWFIFLGLLVGSSEFAHAVPSLTHSLVMIVVSLFFLFCLSIAEPTVSRSPSLRKVGSVVEDGWAEPLRELGERVGLARSSYVLLAGDGANPKSPGPAAYRMEGRTPVFFFDGDVMLRLSPRERLAVFAHELAHHRLDHSRRGTRAATVANLTGAAAFAAWLLLLTGDATVASAFEHRLAPATFLAWLTCLLLQPLYMAHLRNQERHANQLALHITGDPEAFRSAMTTLADHLGAAPVAAQHRPTRWLHWMFDTHPTLESQARMTKQ